jgi:hypothetical protein
VVEETIAEGLRPRLAQHKPWPISGQWCSAALEIHRHRHRVETGTRVYDAQPGAPWEEHIGQRGDAAKSGDRGRGFHASQIRLLPPARHPESVGMPPRSGW